MTFDPTKPVRFRVRQMPATILVTDRPGEGAWKILTMDPKTGELSCQTSDGKGHDRKYDLENVETKTIRFVNVYTTNLLQRSLAESLSLRKAGCIGTLEVTLVDGKLIDAIVHS